MNPFFGWGLAAVALTVGWVNWRWQGVIFAITIIVFWLLLQFNRAVRVMRSAANRPIGYVDSAVMLNARLKERMPLWQVILMTQSIGRQISDSPETFVWVDPGGSEVRIEMKQGKVRGWTLVRP